METIRLVSCDQQFFDVDLETAAVLGTIKTMLESCGMQGGATVPLPNISGDILCRVLHWASNHKDDPPPQEEDDSKERRSDDISPWDIEFLKKADQGTLFELILAANYLDIKGLLDVCCKAIANMIKGKTPEEIRRTFNIKNDFTTAEAANVRKQSDCCWGK